MFVVIVKPKLVKFVVIIPSLAKFFPCPQHFGVEIHPCGSYNDWKLISSPDLVGKLSVTNFNNHFASYL